MKQTPLFEQNQRLQKAMLEIFQSEIQPLNSELQLILINDLVTAFHNRLTVLEKIQTKQ